MQMFAFHMARIACSQKNYGDRVVGCSVKQPYTVFISLLLILRHMDGETVVVAKDASYPVECPCPMLSNHWVNTEELGVALL